MATATDTARWVWACDLNGGLNGEVTSAPAPWAGVCSVSERSEHLMQTETFLEVAAMPCSGVTSCRRSRRCCPRHAR